MEVVESATKVNTLKVITPKVNTPKVAPAVEPKEYITSGTIKITLDGRTIPKVEFTGTLSGRDISIAWRAMFRQYRGWKAGLASKK